MEAVERFKDPLSAAKHIVQEAFRTWLQYEVRTDDITSIVIFIEDFKEGVNVAVRLNSASATTLNLLQSVSCFISLALAFFEV